MSTGGMAATGGMTAACTDGEKGACADYAPTKPVGEATCSDGEWDTTECTLCEPDATVDCSTVPDNDLQFGTATCNSMGEAYDVAGCTLCEAEITVVECSTIADAADEYTGGSATCNDMGDGFDESACEYCGDDIINGSGEQCDDTQVPAETCVGLGFDVGSSAGAELSCEPASCRFDTSECSKCSSGIAANKCMEGDAATCTSSADCAGKQCGNQSSCTFTCGGYGVPCSGMSCNRGATCDFACVGNAGCEFRVFTGIDLFESRPQRHGSRRHLRGGREVRFPVCGRQRRLRH